MAEYPKYVKSFATLDSNKNTTAGPNPSATGVLVNIYDIVNQGIDDGDIDVTGSSLGAVVTEDGAQNITGAKTFSAVVAANAGITVDSTAFTVADTTGNVSTAGTLSVTGASTLTGNVSTSGDMTFTETVTSPATSASLAIKSTQVVHTTDGGALTEVVPINIPDGAVLLGASIIVSVVMGFTTGVEVTPTWTNSTQQIGSTTLAAKNSKVTAMYNANGASAIAGGTPETITLTANAGTIDSGEVVVTAWYMELTGLTDVA